MARKTISVYIEDDTLAEVDLRAEHRERSSVFSRDLERYYYLLTDERKHLRELLNKEEMGLLLDLCNGSLFREPFSIRVLAHEVRDGIALDSLDQKWKVDGEGLVKKIEKLKYASLASLIDAIERWWQRVGRGENALSPEEALK